MLLCISISKSIKWTPKEPPGAKSLLRWLREAGSLSRRHSCQDLHLIFPRAGHLVHISDTDAEAQVPSPSPESCPWQSRGFYPGSPAPAHVRCDLSSTILTLNVLMGGPSTAARDPCFIHARDSPNPSPTLGPTALCLSRAFGENPRGNTGNSWKPGKAFPRAWLACARRQCS